MTVVDMRELVGDCRAISFMPLPKQKEHFSHLADMYGVDLVKHAMDIAFGKIDENQENMKP